MTTPSESRSENPSTYFVQDRSNKEELNRLRIQDQMITAGMGGVLPEQLEPDNLQHILDVGCGSGSWAIEVAQTYPKTSLSAIDISKRMIDYAQAQATAQDVSDRIDFHIMDVLRPLEFPANSFDLVNLRFGGSFLRKWEWSDLLGELQRVTRPGGVIRVTEPESIHQSNSLALTRFCEMLQCALSRAGHYFEDGSNGITAQLAPVLKQQGIQQVQTRAHTLQYQAGTPGGQAYYENLRLIFHTSHPFIQKWGCTSSDYNAICEQALKEMQQSDFRVSWNLLTAWGTSPQKKSVPA